MLAAFLTTVFFSLSAIFANRSIRAVGATQANLGRLLVAALVLGVYAHTWGAGLSGSAVGWLLLSGVVGMGLGDLASFGALPILGSRLTVLVTQCVAAPLAALFEYLWLGTALTARQMGWSSVILAGVVVALVPSRQNPPRVTVKAIGFLWGLGAAAGQGFGAVLSRKAFEVAAQAGETLAGITGAYQRILGGLLITGAFFAAQGALARWREGRMASAEVLARKPVVAAAAVPPIDLGWRRYGWIPLNALCGAVIGVSCYQWALFTTPSGLVLPIVATTPLVIVPLAFWIENERPTVRSLLGGAVAVVGAVGLALAR